MQQHLIPIKYLKTKTIEISHKYLYMLIHAIVIIQK
jgi:hypothetical protein